MWGMFAKLTSMTSLELDNFDFSSISDMTDILGNCNKNLTYCILYTTCYDIGFRPSRDGLHCLGDCDDYLVMDYDNISHYINSLPIPVINITKPNMTEKLIIINRRKKRIETYKVSKNYEEIIESFG